MKLPLPLPGALALALAALMSDQAGATDNGIPVFTSWSQLSVFLIALAGAAYALYHVLRDRRNGHKAVTVDPKAVTDIRLERAKLDGEMTRQLAQINHPLTDQRTAIDAGIADRGALREADHL